MFVCDVFMLFVDEWCGVYMCSVECICVELSVYCICVVWSVYVLS